MDARTWDERYAVSDRVWSAGPNQFVESELADLPPGDALDLACGEGRNAIWLARRGWHVTAMDFSAVAVDRGRTLAGDTPVDWRVGDVLTAELPTVDLVVLSYLQLARAERARAVRRAWSALRPGGTFFLVAHDSTNLAEGTGGPQDASVLYTAEDVLGDLDEASLPQPQMIRAERVEREVSGEDGVSIAYDALVVARLT